MGRGSHEGDLDFAKEMLAIEADPDVRLVQLQIALRELLSGARSEPDRALTREVAERYFRQLALESEPGDLSAIYSQHADAAALAWAVGKPSLYLGFLEAHPLPGHEAEWYSDCLRLIARCYGLLCADGEQMAEEISTLRQRQRQEQRRWLGEGSSLGSRAVLICLYSLIESAGAAAREDAERALKLAGNAVFAADYCGSVDLYTLAAAIEAATSYRFDR